MEFSKAYQHDDKTDFTKIYSQWLQRKKKYCSTIFTGIFFRYVRFHHRKCLVSLRRWESALPIWDFFQIESSLKSVADWLKC